MDIILFGILLAAVTVFDGLVMVRWGEPRNRLCSGAKHRRLNDKGINRKIDGAARLRAYNCVLPAISSPTHEGLKVTRRND